MNLNLLEGFIKKFSNLCLEVQIFLKLSWLDPNREESFEWHFFSYGFLNLVLRILRELSSYFFKKDSSKILSGLFLMLWWFHRFLKDVQYLQRIFKWRNLFFSNFNIVHVQQILLKVWNIMLLLHSNSCDCYRQRDAFWWAK